MLRVVTQNPPDHSPSDQGKYLNRIACNLNYEVVVLIIILMSGEPRVQRAIGLIAAQASKNSVFGVMLPLFLPDATAEPVLIINVIMLETLPVAHQGLCHSKAFKVCAAQQPDSGSEAAATEHFAERGPAWPKSTYPLTYCLCDG